MKSILGGEKVFHLYSLLRVLHYPVSPAKSLLLRQKSDFVRITKQCNNTWGQGIYEQDKAGHYTKCVTLSVSVNKCVDHTAASKLQYSYNLVFAPLVPILCITSHQHGRNREVTVSLFTCLPFQTFPHPLSPFTKYQIECFINS